MLSIDIVGLTGACSYALDCIEAELVNIKNKHGKRVAYISIRMAEYWKIQGEALQDLAMCALLHDNALTQYISEELKKDSVIDLKKDLSEEKTNLHCIYGEKNITKLPFKTDVTNVILYHHEHADGTGPFQKKWNETPLPARIIHLADTVDIIGNSIKSDDNRWDFICQYLSQKKDSLFDSECVNAFLHVFTKESFMCLSDDSFETKLWEIIPREKMVFDWEMCKNVADFFAKIVDYKSSFTSRHSIGVAEKASLLAKYMGYDSITVQKMYLAGALHDIGKMAVGNEILEKPDKLTDDEFSKMKNHAGYTYLILSEVNDFEEIRDWAAFHHEKLNGKGYPFGKTAAELNEPERIMACIDIYQALTEDRPYKKGLSHEKTCEMLDDMAQKGFVASAILESQGAKYRNLSIDSSSNAGKYASDIMAFPTTILVDRNGNIVGDPMLGGIDNKDNYDTLMKQIKSVIAADSNSK